MAAPSRGLLIVLAAVIVVGAVVLVMKLRGGDEDAPAAPPAVATDRPVRPPITPGTVAQPRPRDDLEGEDDAGALPQRPDRGVKVYVLDNGAEIRDHRGEGMPPPIAPPPMRPDMRTMSSAVTAKIYTALAPIVAECAQGVPAVDRGADPFTYVTMTVQVKGGALTTSDVFPTTHDVNGQSAQTFASCVADKGKSIAVAAPDEADHTDYIVQYPIRLR